MLVSAISPNFSKGYAVNNNNTPENIGDTAFNSLTPFVVKKTDSADNTQQDFRNIMEWKNFCHSQITGRKLNIIA